MKILGLVKIWVAIYVIFHMEARLFLQCTFLLPEKIFCEPVCLVRLRSRLIQTIKSWKYITLSNQNLLHVLLVTIKSNKIASHILFWQPLFIINYKLTTKSCSTITLPHEKSWYQKLQDLLVSYKPTCNKNSMSGSL